MKNSVLCQENKQIHKISQFVVNTKIKFYASLSVLIFYYFASPRNSHEEIANDTHSQVSKA